MALSGKRTIGLLEEDNPVKAYFRIRPVCSEGENGFEMLRNPAEMYPDDGYLRIVPDKNEAARFKARMRRIGKFAFIDLRKYQSDDDKIRPNKNYGDGGLERNGNIIFSDVIAEIPAEKAVQVISTRDIESVQIEGTNPGAMLFFAEYEGMFTGPWRWETVTERDDVYHAVRCEEYAQADGIVLPDGVLMQVYENEDTVHTLLVAHGDGKLLTLKSELTQEEEAPVQAEPEPQQPAVQETEPTEEPAPETPPVRQLEYRRRTEPRGERKPHRGLSLIEIIEEQWRGSRMERLGQPVPPEATTTPVMTPVDKAYQAMKAAWALPEARPGMIDAMLSLDELAGLLPERFAAKTPLTAQQCAQLDDYEARRLQAVAELDRLAKAGETQKHALMEKVRQENAAEIRRMEKQAEAARGRLQRDKAAEQAANAAAERAEAALRTLTGDALLEQLITDELKQRAAGMLRAMDAAEKPNPKVPDLYTPTAGELISDVRKLFAGSGIALTHDEAVNLLAGFALFDVNMYSGPAGSGKSTTARLLVQALGLADDRYAEVAGSATDEAYARLNSLPDRLAPAALLIDDANAAPGDPARGLAAHCEGSGAHRELRLLLTVQDAPAGYPLMANLLDRAFFVRIPAPAPDSIWGLPDQYEPEAHGTVSAETLHSMFAPAGEMPELLKDRMQQLRTRLDAVHVRVSGRALRDTYRYILAVLPHMTCTPLEVFDLAVAQRLLPCVLASAPTEALHAMPEILTDLPKCLHLLSQPLAVPEF